MPQPTTTPTAEATPAERQIARAKRLEKERGELMKRIAANREYLRLMEENEELSDEQAAWLDDFYPQKEKGAQRTDAEIERTRKAKAEARGETVKAKTNGNADAAK